MSEPLSFPWPPTVRQPAEDENPGDLALRAVEDAIDAMSRAEARQSPEDWTAVADLLYAASWWARYAAAPLYRAQREAYEAEGLVQCGRSDCRAWRRPDALEAIPAGYAKKSDEEENRSVFLQCQEHSREAA